MGRCINNMSSSIGVRNVYENYFQIDGNTFHSLYRFDRVCLFNMIWNDLSKWNLKIYMKLYTFSNVITQEKPIYM